jgi:hypothetical protein
MRTIAMTLSMLCALGSSAVSQGRGGRQGGEGGPRVMCLNPLNVESIQMLQGPAIVAQLGPAAKNGVAMAFPKPGVSAADLLAPCPGMAGEDILARHAFSPGLVVAHEQAIGLTDTQRSAMAALITDAQKRVIAAQLKTSAEMATLQGLMDASPANEVRVLDQLDRVLGAERDAKREQLALMIRIKNLLTDQQQAALAGLRPPE